jgi:hypothetical protein
MQMGIEKPSQLITAVHRLHIPPLIAFYDPLREIPLMSKGFTTQRISL